MMNHYQYSPLRKNRDEFRLLNLLHGPKSADIELEIFHVKRSSKPEFEALSYVWGPPERTDIALVRERQPVNTLSQLMGSLGIQKRKDDSKPTTTVGITHNLAIALRHLRYSSTSRVLWIDALCINQDDLPERSAEVLEMGSIYSSAREVIVWLGPSSADSRLAIDTLIRLGEGVNHSADEPEITCKSRSWAERLQDDEDTLKTNAPSWIAIRDLLRREWFTRLWVFQEIGLATNATVLVGEERIGWRLFLASLHWLWIMTGHLNELIENLSIEDFGSSSISGFMELTERPNPSPRSLYWLLGRTNKLHTSDPRDRLFAIRSLAAPKDRKLIVPDYSKSVEELFKDFTLRAIQEYRTGYILDDCLLHNTTSNLHLPSWVPDLSLTNKPLPFPAFESSGMSRVIAVNDHQNLSVQGVQIATISHLMPFVTSSNSDSEIIEICRSWQQLCPSGTYVGGGSALDAFLETVSCGYLLELLPPTVGHLLSLKECQRVLESFGVIYQEDEFDTLARKFVNLVRLYLRGRAFFKTQEGFFGVCPESAESGDHVAVLLGCGSIVIRPVVLQGRSCYRVVGQCYVPGVMHGEALLGPLPDGWVLKYEYVAGKQCQVFTERNTVTQKDPRVPLPPRWRYRYKDGKTFHNSELNTSKHMCEQFFENVETKEITWVDPRLTPEALREKGVDIQEFVLV